MNELKNKTELERTIFEEEAKINYIEHQIKNSRDFVNLYKDQLEYMDEQDEWNEKISIISLESWKDSAHYVETKVKYELLIEEVNELHEKLEFHNERINRLKHMKELFDKIDGIKESV